MSFDAHANFAYGTVATAPSPATSGTSLTLQTGQGALMPTAPFNGVAWPAGVDPIQSNAEIVRVTVVTGDVLTLTRAQEGTTARVIVVGDQFSAAITKKTLTDIESATGGGGTGTVTHTAGALTLHALVLGNAAADVKVLGSLGTATTVLHGAAAGDPSFSEVDLAADVTGVLPQVNGGTGKDTSAATNGQILVGKTSDHSLNLATVTPGVGIGVTNGAGAITISRVYGTVTLTDGATPALDASLGETFRLAAAGNRTIAVPSNAIAGQKITIQHYASGGARTLALNTGTGGFRFGSDITSLSATASGKTDYIGAIYNDTDNKWDVVAVIKGF